MSELTFEPTLNNSIFNTEKTLLILGPTGVGKSALAIQLAKQLNREIISADAFQVYKHMDIGTAKVSKEIQREIPHHLIDIIEPNEPYSVAHFTAQTDAILTKLKTENKKAIICGGTGFFLKAFLYRYEFPDLKTDANLREKYIEKASEYGSEAIWTKLQEIDPATAESINKNDTKRIIRALEIFTQTNTKPSEVRQNNKDQRTDVEIIGLSMPRETLIDVINKRVDIMIKEGLIEDVETLLKTYSDKCLAFQAIGYKETIQFLNGSLSKEEMIELVKLKTRQFSKRQMTWYRNLNNVQWHNVT